MVRFVPGFTQTGTSWGPVAERLGRAGETLELLDVPERVSFVATAHALAADHTAGRAGPATYVGYSQGGRLCLQLALDRPEAVARLVLVSASPGIADDHARAARVESDEALAREIERDGVDAFLERWLALPLFATLPRERSGIDDRKAHATVAGLTHQLRVLGQGVQPSNWARLGDLRMPVLLLAGELDTKYVEFAQQMAAAVTAHAGDVRVEIVPGAGHACHLEQPEFVAHVLDSFLSDHA